MALTTAFDPDSREFEIPPAHGGRAGLWLSRDPDHGSGTSNP